MSGVNVVIKDILNSVLESINNVIPLEVAHKAPVLINNTDIVTELGVIIGVIGDVKGQIIIDSNKDITNKIAEAMFGMSVEGDMLYSFMGELGNMIAGNTATVASTKGTIIDIAPPNIVTGKIRGFEKGIKVGLNISNYGLINVILTLK